MNIRVLILRTDFKHHGEDSGYKQILKYIKPYKIFGINERDSSDNRSKLKSKYPWLFEFDASSNRGDANIVHILYGEDYFRWSTKLFKNIPVIVTFHQPADTLEREVIYGDYRGRIGRITHLLTKNRFKKLAAAIVTNYSQKEVLKKVMHEDKIHVIPLGIHLNEMKNRFKTFSESKELKDPENRSIITVGNWLRDWDFYFKIVEAKPDWKFCLVNQKLDFKYTVLTEKYKNLRYYSNISDEEMFNLFLEASLQFIPVTGMAASNSLVQGLALGCPLVLTDINAEQYQNEEPVITLYQKGDVKDCVTKLSAILNLSDEDLDVLKNKAHLYSHEFSWEEVANKTIKIYNQLV